MNLFKKRLLSVIVLLALVFLFACNDNTVNIDDANAVNVNNSANEHSINETVTTGAQLGDLVEINYVLTFENGTAASTNNPELAAESGLKNYVKGPFKFILGQSGIVSGFDTAIIGMEPGEHRETIIESSEKELVLPINRTMVQSRFIAIPRYQQFSMNSFKKMFNKEPIMGDVIFAKELLFKYQVINKTDDAVLGKILTKEGDEYALENTEWPSKVLKVTDDELLFGQMPEQNQTLQSPFGNATVTLNSTKITIKYDPELNRVFNKTVRLQGNFGVDQQFQVIDVHDDYFVIKRYGLLTDKRLNFSIDLLNITAEAVKEVAADKPNPLISV